MNSTNAITIALVDDAPLVRYALQKVLVDWGYKLVIEAVNGRDFFRQLTSLNAPDICISDIDMPEMNGYETIRALKLKWPGIRIIAFSAGDEEDKKSSILRTGADMFVDKGAPLQVLKSALQAISNRIGMLADPIIQ